MKKNIFIFLISFFLLGGICNAELIISSHKKIKDNQIEITFNQKLANEPISGFLIDSSKNKIKISGFGNSESNKVIMRSQSDIPEKYTVEITNALSVDGEKIIQGETKAPESGVEDISFLLDEYNKNTEETISETITENNKEKGEDNPKENEILSTENVGNSEKIKSNETIIKQYNPEEAEKKQVFIVMMTLIGIFLMLGLFAISQIPKGKKKK